MGKQSNEKIVHLLLSGKHPLAKKYAGHHVMVIGSEIIPVKKGKQALQDINRLEKKYGETPTLLFIPRQDITYILVKCAK